MFLVYAPIVGMPSKYWCFLLKCFKPSCHLGVLSIPWHRGNILSNLGSNIFCDIPYSHWHTNKSYLDFSTNSMTYYVCSTYFLLPFSCSTPATDRWLLLLFLLLNLPTWRIFWHKMFPFDVTILNNDVLFGASSYCNFYTFQNFENGFCLYNRWNTSSAIWVCLRMMLWQNT